MKIITYGDLHLEFGTAFFPPEDSDADLMIQGGRDEMHLLREKGRDKLAVATFA